MFEVHLDETNVKLQNNYPVQKERLLSFIRSQRGAPLLARFGFLYRCERHTGERSYWLCIRYKNLKCGGRLICQGNDVVKYRSHNHAEDWNRIANSIVEYRNLASPEINDFLNSFKINQ